jgi:hypothetical protein
MKSAGMMMNQAPVVSKDIRGLLLYELINGEKVLREYGK